MKNVLKILMTIIMMFVINDSQAQVRFGPKVGLNLSNMTLTLSGLAYDPVGETGVNFGIVSEIPLKNNIVLQPGILYTQKGASYTYSGSELSILPTYIEIPVNAMCKSSMGAIDLLIFAGPYAGYGVGGESISPGGSEAIVFGSGADKDMKVFDFGLNVGAGIELFDFQLTAHYGFSLKDLTPVTADNQEMKNEVFSFSVAYMIGNE